LNQRSAQHKQKQRLELIHLVLVDDGIDEKSCGVRQHQGRDPVDHHQEKPEREQPTPGTHQLPDFRQDGAQSLDLGFFIGCFRVCTQSLVGLRRG